MNVDTKAAREFANASYTYTGEEVRLWVHNLADEVDSLRNALTVARSAYECFDGIKCNLTNRADCDKACARFHGANKP